jgi:hypothetical protein
MLLRGLPLTFFGVLSPGEIMIEPFEVAILINIVFQEFPLLFMYVVRTSLLEVLKTASNALFAAFQYGLSY